MNNNPYRRFCREWWRYYLRIPQNTYEFVKRIIDYAPILWNDRDWDYSFLLRLLKFKLSRMETVCGSPKSHAADWEQIKVELATAQLLISKIEDDPDDEWSLHWDQYHLSRCKDKCECDTARLLSEQRRIRNWHALWKYLDKHMPRWWD